MPGYAPWAYEEIAEEALWKGSYTVLEIEDV